MAMYAAALNGDVQQVKSLLGNGRVRQVDEHGITPLALAAFGGQSQVVSVLLKSDPAAGRVVDARGRTPLHWAAIGGHCEVIEQLLREGADVNASDRDGEAPLHAAARFGKPGAFALLLAYGADVAVTDRDGCTPIDLARDAEDRELRDAAVVAELESQIDE
jgi:ankyrin repeat protein